MKKVLITIAILISFVDFAIGQNEFSISLKIIPQYVFTSENSSLQLNKVFNLNYSSNFEVGYKFKRLKLQTGIIFSKQKQKFDVQFEYDLKIPNRELTIDLTYLKIPFYINYRPQK